MSRSPYLPARILEVYIEALTGFSHVYCPDGLSNTILSQGYLLVIAPTVGTMGREYIPRTGVWGGEEPPKDWVQLSDVNWWSLPLHDLLQHMCNYQARILMLGPSSTGFFPLPR